jgi:hypothetical protein
VGVRIYFALDLNNNLTTVLVGTDNADNDITSGTLLNRGIKCPPQCSLNSPLL